MGLFDKLRERIDEFEDKAEDAAVEVEDLVKSDDELEAELEAELAALEEEAPSPEQETAEPADAGAVAPEPPAETDPDPATSTPEQARPEPTHDPAPAEPAAEAAPEPGTAAEPAPPRETPEPSSTGQKVPEATVPTEGKYGIDPDRAEDLLWDLELLLLEADVATDVAIELREHIADQLPKIRVDDKSQIPDAIEASLREAIRGLLEGSRFDFDEWLMTQEDRPLTIMFVGVNGTGKTTTIARLAHRLKEIGFGIVLAAGDTFRAGAIEQLEQHGEKLGLRVIKHSAGSDPAAVAYDAVDHAKARKKDVILLDTAGRMQTNSNLMDEMRKIDRVANPDLTVYVGDSLAGNDAIEQAKEFDSAVGVDCCVLTKVDTDAKGGAALSIAREVGKPIAFLGVGQNYDDLIPFSADWLVERIFGE